MHLCMSYMVPFRHDSRVAAEAAEVRVLHASVAADWLACAFRRGGSRVRGLHTADVLAEQSFSSSDSVRRSQVVTSFVSEQGQSQRIADRLRPGLRPQTSAVIAKRLWDETQIRLQVSKRNLRGMFPMKFVDTLTSAHSQSRKRYPGFCVQSVEQVSHFRWGAVHKLRIR